MKMLKNDGAKRLLSILLTLCMALALLPPMPAHAAESYTLKIVNGTSVSSATIPGGETELLLAQGQGFSIKANDPPAGKTFDKWVSKDGVAILSPVLNVSWITMPGNNATVTATYKNDPQTDTEMDNIKAYIKSKTSAWLSPMLTPAFDKSAKNYTLNVEEGYDSIYFYLKERHKGQELTASLDGVNLKVDLAVNGFSTVQTTLNKATTTFVFKVTALDKKANDTYTITVNYGDASSYSYPVTINNGWSTKTTYRPGEYVQIGANEKNDSGQVFDKWVTLDGVNIQNDQQRTTAFRMLAKPVTVTATYKDLVTSYPVTVNGGTTNTPNSFQGDTVTIKANPPATGKVFYKWLAKSIKVIITDVYNANTTFIMPAMDATVTASYKDATYAVTVKGGLTPAPKAEGSIVDIKAKPPSPGKLFDKWETSDGVIFADPNSINTTFIMPAKEVTVTATYKDVPAYVVIVTEGTTATPTPFEGETITITANPPATGKVFEKWETADGVSFINPNNSTTTFKMPAKSVTVTAKYADALIPKLTGTVVISGIGKVGEKLTAKVSDTNGIDPFTYQWKRGSKDIGGNSPTYTPLVGDLGETLTCLVTASNTVGSLEGTSMIIVEAEVEIVPPAEFMDVPKDKWFYDPIIKAIEKGWFSGTSDTSFSPNVAMSRGMIVTVLWRIEGEPASEASSFSDVGPGNYYTTAVKWAAEQNIVNGYGNNIFGPNKSINREQMASILYRYAEYKGYDTTQGGMALKEFADYTSISTYALPTLAWGVNAGLMQGANNKLMPKDSATRAQVAAILIRFSETLAK